MKRRETLLTIYFSSSSFFSNFFFCLFLNIIFRYEQICLVISYRHRITGSFISPLSKELVNNWTSLRVCVWSHLINLFVLRFIFWRFRINVTRDDFRVESNYTIRSIPTIYYPEGNLSSILPDVMMTIN